MTPEPEQLYQGQSWPSICFQKLCERQFLFIEVLVFFFTSSKFFAEELRITETKLALFMGGEFLVCVALGIFFS